MSVSRIPRAALQVTVTLSTESLIRPVPTASRDDGHGNVGAESGDGHDLPESALGEELGNARATDECSVELSARDEKLTSQPGRTDAVVSVVVVDKCKAAFA